MASQREVTFCRVNVVNFPDLYAIKTNSGMYLFCDTHSYRILSGLDITQSKKALHRYYQRHYAGKEFLSILANPSVSEHVCTFVNPTSGKPIKAFSLSGLEYLCNHITGKNAEENKPKFLELIKKFRSSIADEPAPEFPKSSEPAPEFPKPSEDSAANDNPQIFAEDREIALLHQSITPIVRQNLDQLYTRWEADEAKLHEQAKAAGKAPFGACYAAVCPVFGHLIKLGCTLRSPMERVCELSSSGVPEPFQLVAVVHCFWPKEIEKRIHQHFAFARTYGKKKEFFALSVKQVDGYYTRLAHELVGSGGPGTQTKKRKAAEQNDILRAVLLEQAAQRAMLERLIGGGRF